MRIAIAGVGVAGGVIATGLAALPGVEVLAFEQVGPDDHAVAGNGLNVGPNAIRVARRVLPDFAGRLEAASLPWRAWTTWTMTGDPLYRIALADVADEPGIRIRWAELYRVCREAARSVVRFQVELRGVQVEPRGVRVEIAPHAGAAESIDGIDLLIAAEGRYSPRRAALAGPPLVRHLGIANFRCLLDDRGTLPLDDFEQWFNAQSRFIAFRLADGLIYLSGNFPIAAGADIAPEQKTAEYFRRVYTPRSGTIAALPHWLLEGACRMAPELHWSRAQENDTLWHDASARVLFPGDAGHAMAPTIGQGATTAIEDGALFVAMFRDAWAASSGALDVPALVRRYAAARAARIEFIKRFSWDASNPLLLGADADALNRKKDGPEYRAGLAHVYREI